MKRALQDYAQQFTDERVDALTVDVVRKDDEYPEFDRALQFALKSQGDQLRTACISCAKILAKEAYRRGLHDGARLQFALLNGLPKDPNRPF